MYVNLTSEESKRKRNSTTLHYSTKWRRWVGGPGVLRHMWDSYKTTNPLSFYEQAGVPRRAIMQWILNVHIKTYKFARGACIRHALNNRASASERHTLSGLITGPHFVPMIPNFGPPRCKNLALPLYTMNVWCTVDELLCCNDVLWDGVVMFLKKGWIPCIDLELQTVETPAFHFR